MTAAPGPQQPDDVRPVWPDDREWVTADQVTCMYCQRYKNRKVCRCGDPNPPVRPASPSAQPGYERESGPSVGDSGGPHNPVIAPSDQPDEDNELEGILALDAALHRLGPGALRQRSHRRLAQLLYADGVRVVDLGSPAQPVRDTEEGRR